MKCSHWGGFMKKITLKNNKLRGLLGFCFVSAVIIGSYQNCSRQVANSLNTSVSESRGNDPVSQDLSQVRYQHTIPLFLAASDNCVPAVPQSSDEPEPIPNPPSSASSASSLVGFCVVGGPESFIRIINLSNRKGTISIYATDDTGTEFGPVSLSLEAKKTVHFNSRDLEIGNDSLGLEGLGDGTGHWRLSLLTMLEIKPLVYARTKTSLNSINEMAKIIGSEQLRVHFFNPADNTTFRSLLRLVNPNNQRVMVLIRGTDDNGTYAGGVDITLEPKTARNLTALDLENGPVIREGDAVREDPNSRGSLGDGVGKWTLNVSKTATSGSLPIYVMNLMSTPSGFSDLSKSFTVVVPPPPIAVPSQPGTEPEVGE